MSMFTHYLNYAILVSVLVIGIYATGASASPQLPCEFYGNITIHGSAAPAGTVVNAFINDSPRGSIIIHTPGVYGGKGTFEERLIVNSTDADFSGGIPMIKFKVGSEPADQVIPYDPGTSTEMKITVGEKNAQSGASTPVVLPVASVTSVAITTPVSVNSTVVPPVASVTSVAVTTPVSVNSTVVPPVASVTSVAVTTPVSVNSTVVPPVASVTSAPILQPAVNGTAVLVNNTTSQTSQVTNRTW